MPREQDCLKLSEYHKSTAHLAPLFTAPPQHGSSETGRTPKKLTKQRPDTNKQPSSVFAALRRISAPSPLMLKQSTSKQNSVNYSYHPRVRDVTDESQATDVLADDLYRNWKEEKNLMAYASKGEISVLEAVVQKLN